MTLEELRLAYQRESADDGTADFPDCDALIRAAGDYITALEADSQKWEWICRQATREPMQWRGWTAAQVIEYYGAHYDADVLTRHDPP